MQRLIVGLLLLAVLITSCASDDDDTTPLPSDTSGVAPITPVGDAAHGAALFADIGIDDVPPCISCHVVNEGDPLPPGYQHGPNLGGVSERARQLAPGGVAADYLRASILTPSAHIVDGFGDLMFPDYATVLTDQDVADLVAYLMSL